MNNRYKDLNINKHKLRWEKLPDGETSYGMDCSGGFKGLVQQIVFIFRCNLTLFFLVQTLNGDIFSLKTTSLFFEGLFERKNIRVTGTV